MEALGGERQDDCGEQVALKKLLESQQELKESPHPEV